METFFSSSLFSYFQKKKILLLNQFILNLR